jgi:hypothetical protein
MAVEKTKPPKIIRKGFLATVTPFILRRFLTLPQVALNSHRLA